MSRITTGSRDTDKSILSVVLGFLGVTAAFFLLPKTVKYVIRRFFLGIVSEVVAVVVTGLLTEKLVDVVGSQREEDQLPQAGPH